MYFPLKPYTLAGFEPGSSDPEADAMSTAPRRRNNAIFSDYSKRNHFV
jgi:hypothetical protein